MTSRAFLRVSPDRREEFVRKGYLPRHFFPHDIHYLPKCGPDGWKQARRLRVARELDQLWEVVLYATGAPLRRFPRSLFFDDEVVWHQQQFGKPGQVATANLVLRGRVLYSMVHVSDVVQRISRRREHKTRIENTFKGWHHMLLNAVLYFARRNGAAYVHVPTARSAMGQTDLDRSVGPELFNRLYDRNVGELFAADRVDGWWRIDVERNLDRLVAPVPRVSRRTAVRTICVSHDIEHGQGHLDNDPRFATFAGCMAEEHLAGMLAAERTAHVRVTYNVPGLLMAEVRGRLEAGGHCVAFHGYDHRIPSTLLPRGAPRAAWHRLRRCRSVDYRIKGYRVPQSQIGPDLTDVALCWHNFEWLASSVDSLGFALPRVENRLVKIPILLDDSALRRGPGAYPEWERRTLEVAAAADFAALALRDAHAPVWLPHYGELLRKLRELGRLATLDEVAAEVALAHASSFPRTAEGEDEEVMAEAGEPRIVRLRPGGATTRAEDHARPTARAC